MVQSFSSARLSATREPYPVRTCFQPFVVTRPSSARVRFRTTRGCFSRAPHSPIGRQRGVSGPREGEPFISTRLSAPKVTHPDRGGTHRRPRTPQADRPPHPTRSWAAAPGPPHCPRAGMGVAAGPLQAIPRDTGTRNALHSQASPVARPCFVLRRGVIPGWPWVRSLIA